MLLAICPVHGVAFQVLVFGAAQRITNWLLKWFENLPPPPNITKHCKTCMIALRNANRMWSCKGLGWKNNAKGLRCTPSKSGMLNLNFAIDALSSPHQGGAHYSSLNGANVCLMPYLSFCWASLRCKR